jgi:hypothetical protein
MVDRAFSLTHPRFCGLLCNWFVREDADPVIATTPGLTHDHTTRCFDLTAGYPTTFQGLQAILAKRYFGAATRTPFHSPTELFSKLDSLGQQHNSQLLIATCRKHPQ